MYKVLIVEDDPMVAMINEQFVSRHKDFVVAHKCNDGKSALEYLDENEVDLIILDVFMPYMDGFETLKIIRSKEHLEALPVIMLTAVDTEQKQIFGLKFGADDYIVKPFSLPNLLARIEAILRRVKITEKEIASKTKAVSVGKDVEK